MVTLDPEVRCFDMDRNGIGGVGDFGRWGVGGEDEHGVITMNL